MKKENKIQEELQELKSTLPPFINGSPFTIPPNYFSQFTSTILPLTHNKPPHTLKINWKTIALAATILFFIGIGILQFTYSPSTIHTNHYITTSDMEEYLNTTVDIYEYNNTENTTTHQTKLNTTTTQAIENELNKLTLQEINQLL